MQIPDTRGNPVDDPSGHGSTLENEGSYFNVLDMGYGYIMNDRFPVNAELSLGKKVLFTNYLDSGFTDGGYHTIGKKNIAIGLGADLGYNFRDLFEVYAGYHTLRKVYLGIRIPIPDFLPWMQNKNKLTG